MVGCFRILHYHIPLTALSGLPLSCEKAASRPSELQRAYASSPRARAPHTFQEA